jgi:hypothetical protein
MTSECCVHALTCLDNDESPYHTVDSGPTGLANVLQLVDGTTKELGCMQHVFTGKCENTACRKQYKVMCCMCCRADATRSTYLRFANGQRQHKEPQQDNGDSWLRERKQPWSKRLRRLRRVRLLFRAKGPEGHGF